MKCPVCGYDLNPERDLDAQMQRYFELHLQVCAMRLEQLKLDYLRVIAQALVDQTVAGTALEQLARVGIGRGA